MIRNLIGLILVFIASVVSGQSASVSGVVSDNGTSVPFVNIILKGTEIGTSSDENGVYHLENLNSGNYVLLASAIGYEPFRKAFTLSTGHQLTLNIKLVASAQILDETVVTGTLKAVNRMDSPVPVEVYSPTFLKKNPTANLFDALQNVNGVRPQINCSVCNTGDIHINGLEGPYTLVMIDGMPIVSGLGTVYGLSGIPNSLIEQIEIVKGPASTLYGSEAVAGLINIITKHAPSAPEYFGDAFVTGYGEYNLDAGTKFSLGKRADVLLGFNYFNYDVPIDDNNDNFTDVTLQDRISIFQKWNFKRKKSRLFSLAGRFFYEDRWGGELQWTPEFRGGDEVYGESIYTRRWEVITKYDLPLKEKITLSLSYNDHNQNSAYGNELYLADQRIGFGQLLWDKKVGKHDLLIGSTLRYNYYDDNTPATADGVNNRPNEIWLPGLFAQDEYQWSEKHSLLGGLRYDYDSRHGSIFTPRLAYKWKLGDNAVLRFNTGTGFRVVNLFTEDHAALSGAREVIIAQELQPEQSINFNINYLQKFYGEDGSFVSVDASAFYTNFSNVILPDYDTNPNQIIYDNLDGTSISQGLSANINWVMPNGLRILAGATIQEVKNTEDGITQRQILSESFTGTWNLSYTFRNLDLSVDYTGNIYGPMRLPLVGDLDPRSEFSPTWSIQNIQFTYKGIPNFEFYGGIKNLLDWRPTNTVPFIIAGANDPFDRNVQFDSNGNAIPTTDNPFALTFDPNYVYGPNQGIRGFFGLRYTIF